MPIYEYECPACQAVFERLIRNPREEAELACPKCEATNVSRKLSVFAARSAAPARALPTGGGCACGDPAGPCNFG